MAQVISENSITMSPARRRFLTFAAGASVASVGSLAAASLPIAIPAKAAADPILNLIETHRKIRRRAGKLDLDKALPRRARCIRGVHCRAGDHAAWPSRQAGLHGGTVKRV